MPQNERMGGREGRREGEEKSRKRIDWLNGELGRRKAQSSFSEVQLRAFLEQVMTSNWDLAESKY